MLERVFRPHFIWPALFFAFMFGFILNDRLISMRVQHELRAPGPDSHHFQHIVERQTTSAHQAVILELYSQHAQWEAIAEKATLLP